MKMETINISLPPEMAEYVRNSTKRFYGNQSEFFRDLVRRKFQDEIAADVQFLEKAIAGATAGPSQEQIDIIIAAQREARGEMAGK